MTSDLDVPELGQIVRVTKGREQDQYAIVIGLIDTRFVLLADGEKRKYDRPKKKNKMHIEYTPFISSDVRKSLLETNRVSNGKLRFALSKFHSEVVTSKRRETNSDV